MPAHEHTPLVLEEYQRTMGHVVTHPELEHALHEAASSKTESDLADGVDVLPFLEKRGFVLPPGSTAHLRKPKTDRNDEPPVLTVCIAYGGFGGHTFCAEFQFPIVIT